MVGEQSYSIKIGDFWHYTIDWDDSIEPFTFIGAKLFEPYQKMNLKPNLVML